MEVNRAGWVMAGMVVVLIAFGGRDARAQSSNYWGTNVHVAVFSGNFDNINHWSAGAKPTANNESVFFTNQQAGYTVTFTGAENNGQVLVMDDNVTFDLAGNTWNAIGGFYMSNANVTVTSSAGQGDLYAGNYPMVIRVEGTPAAWCTLTITNAKMRQFHMTFNDHLNTRYAYVNVLGPTAELYSGRYYFHGGLGGIVTVADGAKITYGGATFLGSRLVSAADALTEITIRNGSTLDSWAGWASASVLVGDYTTTRVNILTNSTWLARELTLGSTLWSPALGSQGSYGGDVTVDAGSRLIVEANVFVGNTSVGPGRLRLRDGSMMSVSNGAVLVRSPISGRATNTLVLDNSTITLGGGDFSGTMTNRGIMQANGTICGLGTAPATVRNEQWMEVGSSIGTLVVSNANLVNATSGTMAFKFDAMGCDRIAITNGTASIAGTLDFKIANGFTPTKATLPVYDFVTADSIDYSATDNMSSLMASFGLVENKDYRFGVVATPNGETLRIEALPPAGTVIMIW